MNNNDSDIEHLVDFISELKEFELGIMSLILNNKDAILSKYEYEKNKLPYNINLLDEIHANENAHSRILVKILKYTLNGDYVILRSFLDFLGEPFSELRIFKPEITAERDRIDARIRDKTFSIIIENKIWGALDQKDQIERYVAIEKAWRRNESDIYILYLTLEGGSPSENSISKDRRNEFLKRYKEISFKCQILTWIKDILLPLIQIRIRAAVSDQMILESAVIQYKNFLEGKFNQREGETVMKTEMQKIITEKLGLNDPVTDSEKLRKIIDYRDYSIELQNFLNQKENEFVRSVLKKFSEQLINLKIDGIREISRVKDFGQQYSEVQFKPTNWPSKYVISVCFEEELGGLFYGIKDNTEPLSKSEKNPLIDILLKLLGKGDDPTIQWIYWVWILEEVNYLKLIELIEHQNLSHFIVQKVTELLDKTKAVTFE